MSLLQLLGSVPHARARSFVKSGCCLGHIWQGPNSPEVISGHVWLADGGLKDSRFFQVAMAVMAGSDSERCQRTHERCGRHLGLRASAGVESLALSLVERS